MHVDLFPSPSKRLGKISLPCSGGLLPLDKREFAQPLSLCALPLLAVGVTPPFTTEWCLVVS